MEMSISEIKIGKNELREVLDDQDMDDLVASIRRIGLVQPLVVRRRGAEVVLVAGHRRYRACQIVGLPRVPVVVRGDSEGQDHEVAFAENLFRKDLSAVETAAGLKDVLALGTLSVEDVARGVHRSVDWVRRMVAMCDWPGDVLLAIHQGWLSVAAGANVALVTDDEYRAFLLRQAEESGATARVTAAWLQAWRSMMPVDQAVQCEPVPPGGPVTPLIPQLPCFVCGAVMRMDSLSHVPVCGGCVGVLREVGARMSGAESV